VNFVVGIHCEYLILSVDSPGREYVSIDVGHKRVYKMVIEYVEKLAMRGLIIAYIYAAKYEMPDINDLTVNII
jgi:hypothetical protein